MGMKIDWYAMTFGDAVRHPQEIADALRDVDMHHLLQGGFGKVVPWRPFTHGYGNEHFRVQWQASQDWTHLTITGAGCALDRIQLRGFVLKHAEQTTRIDLALDLDTVLDPLEHATTVTSRSKSVMQSDAGSTLYIGSRKSDSFVRVYRYNEPHERAGVTRIEAEFKGAYAPRVAEAFTMGKTAEIAAFVARKSNTEHLKDWKMEPDTKPITMSKAADRTPGQDGWQRWVKQAALPSVIRAVEQGVLTRYEIDRLLDAVEYGPVDI